jgi:ankyrin repeat protein
MKKKSKRRATGRGTKILVAGVAAAGLLASLLAAWLLSGRGPALRPLVLAILEDYNEARDEVIYKKASSGFQERRTLEELQEDMKVRRAALGRFVEAVTCVEPEPEKLDAATTATVLSRLKFQKGEALGALSFKKQGEGWQLEELDLQVPPKLLGTGDAGFGSRTAALLEGCSQGKTAEVYQGASIALQKTASLADFEAFIGGIQNELGQCKPSGKPVEKVIGRIASFRTPLQCAKGESSGLFRFADRAGDWKLLSIEIPAPAEAAAPAKPTPQPGSVRVEYVGGSPEFTEAEIAELRKQPLSARQILEQELFQAIVRGKADRIVALVQTGAEVNAADALGETALMNAAKFGQVESVKALLQSGADPNAKHGSGLTALAIAALDGHPKVFASLVEAGADIKVQGGAALLALAQYPRDELTPSGSVVAMAGDDAAAPSSLVDTAQALIEAGADVNATDAIGRPVLHLAAGSGKRDLVRLLLEAGVNPDAKDKEGHTALAEAISKDKPEAIQVLLEAGASANAKGDYEQPCLALAVGKRSMKEETIKLLIEAGANVNTKGILGTPLKIAIENDRPEIAKILRDAGAKE